MDIDICMTAALRPDIIKSTLCSLENNLDMAAHSVRLIVDIAKVGDLHFSQQGVLAVIYETVPSWDVLPRTLPECSIQAEALRWTWQTSTSPFILQWEDDWTLEKKVSLSAMIECFFAFPKLGILGLDRIGKSVLGNTRYSKGTFAQVDVCAFQRNKSKSLGGPPAMMCRNYINAVIPLLDGVTCLDVLSAAPKAQKILSNWGVFIFTGLDNKGGLVKDIGKQWRSDRGLKMVKNTDRGVTWTKKS